MQQLNRQDLTTQADVPAEEPSFAVRTPPGRTARGRRIAAIVGLTVLLAVVFGTGLFSGWVYGTRNAGSLLGSPPTTTNSPVTIAGNSLDAAREAAVEKVRPAVVQITIATASGEGLGSGVILDSRGFIVTNNHVVTGAQRIQVTLFDGASLPAQLVGADPLDDLAVVKVSTTAKLTAATLGDSSKLRVGQEVLAIGNPLGITQTVTSGIISALDRAVSSIPDAIQTDAAINPGNSGGALVDLQGELVGIPTLSAIDPQFQTPANGVGFAIPSNRVRLIAPQLIETGKVTHTGRAVMGVQIASVDAALAAQNNLPVTSGALIVGVTPGSPAAIAGLKAGDIIAQIGTHPVADVASFADALLTMSPGQKIAVHVYRGDRQLTVNVTLGEARVQ
ncbi:MAG TPA: trypsin-like peptidase domain-containing protein [Ktedonobacteraceae bacterium]|nr:trypsin-like peptidase domain-containing protein [Ktedonobacteraceae bacterium]